MKHTGRRICIIAAVIFFLFMLAAAYYFADQSFMRRNREKYAMDLEWLASVISSEKQWIRQNQGGDGQIYMNGEKAGDINPYFSCHAALGLLESTGSLAPSDADIAAVRDYLNWHTARLIESGGITGTYRYTDGSLVRTKKADSVDAYLGTYLELLGKYALTCGSAKTLEHWDDGVSLAVSTLRKLTFGSLTNVSFKNDTQYMMDNLEVWKGLCVLESCFQAGVLPEKGLSQIRADADAMRQGLESAVTEVFWNGELGCWRVTPDDSGFDGEKFYPDGIAQIYPLIFGFPVENGERQAQLYRQFTDKFAWQEIRSDGKTFLWAMTSLAAANAGDTGTLKTFLKNYEEMTLRSRAYPLYTGEAGWVCRSSAALYKIYSAEMNRHLFF